MATTNRVYILAAFFFSAIGAVFNIVSLGTENWINGDATWVSDDNGIPNVINYGLFQGNYKRSMPFSTTYQVTMTCSFKNNVCALLCGSDAEVRNTLLDNLYNNQIDAGYSYSDCPQVNSKTYSSFENRGLRADASTSVSRDSFINAGVWLCTLITVILAALLGLIASVLALYNTVTNPIQYFLSVNSLFVYNTAAFCCTVLYMVLWGAMYNITIFHNIGVYDTLVHNINSDKRAYLGYSYWIGFLPLAFYTGSMAILQYRQYLNARDPKQKMVNLDVDSADPNLYLY